MGHRFHALALGDHLHHAARLAFEQFAHLIGLHAGDLATIHLKDLIARPDARFHGRIALVRITDVDAVVGPFDQRPDTPVLPGGHEAIVLHIALRDVLGVGVERVQHRIDAGLHQLARLGVIHVVDVQFLVQLGEDLEVLADLEVAVGRGDGEGAAAHDGRAHEPELPLGHACVVLLIHVSSVLVERGRDRGRPRDDKIGCA